MKSRGSKIILLVVLFSTSLHAQVVFGRWEKLDSQPAGKGIVVTLKAGDRLECALEESSNDNLTVVTSTGGELKIAKSEVEKIESLEDLEDSALNGTLIGALAGFGLIAAISFPHDDPNLALIPLVTGAGAVVGLLVDRSHKSSEVLYQAASEMGGDK